jgi:hypothetical protein
VTVCGLARSHSSLNKPRLWPAIANWRPSDRHRHPALDNTPFPPSASSLRSVQDRPYNKALTACGQKGDVRLVPSSTSNTIDQPSISFPSLFRKQRPEKDIA